MENRTKGLDLLEDFIGYRENDGRDLYHSIQNYLVRKLNGDSFTADDVMQDVLLKSWRFKDKYDSSQRLSPWLFTVTNNCLRDYQRKNRNHNKNVSLDRLSGNEKDKEYELVGSDMSPDEESSRNEDARILREKIEELPEDNKKVLRLINYKGLKHTEAAEVLNIPLGTVKSRVRQGMKLLRKSYNTHTKVA
ncbi:RNA polymerase sigma factor [Candidatus Pacearchaeota archaeon]|nr:RNA polymerase sigma factor [Candidatus Pacearchaeota archaeon]